MLINGNLASDSKAKRTARQPTAPRAPTEPLERDGLSLELLEQFGPLAR